MARPTREYQAFRDRTDRLLTVSEETVDKPIADENAKKAERPRPMRPGGYPKPPGDRVSQR